MKNRLIFLSAFVALWLTLTIFSVPKSLQAGCIIVFTLVLWAVGRLPQWFVALLFFVLCAISQIVSAQVFLSGFVSPAVWLLVAGSFIGLAIKHTGLGYRLANALLPMMRSYPLTLFSVAMMGFVLIFLMPSAVGRVMVLIPIILPLIEQLGYQHNKTARNGILLAAITATFFPAFSVLPANVPNNILFGIVKMLFKDSPTYGDYLLLHLPVLGLLKLVLLLGLLNVFYRAPAPAIIEQKPPIISGAEKRLLLILLMVFILWLTESVHGINTAWVAMLGAVCCLYPAWKLVPKNPLQQIKLEALFYVAAIVSVGGVAYHSGLATTVANAGIKLLPFDKGSHLINFTVFSSLSALLSGAVTLPTVPAILTPITEELSQISGWPTTAVYMSQVVGFSTVFFPYQAPPLVIGMQMAEISAKEMLRLLIVMAVLTILLLWPLDYCWWQFLGMFK